MRKISVLLVGIILTINSFAQSTSEIHKEDGKTTNATEQKAETGKEVANQNQKKNAEVKEEKMGEVKVDLTAKGKEVSSIAKETVGGPEKGQTVKSIAKSGRQPKPEKVNNNGRPEGVERSGRPGGANAPGRRPMIVNRPAGPGRR